jgi:serine/threonine protein kinase
MSEELGYKTKVNTEEQIRLTVVDETSGDVFHGKYKLERLLGAGGWGRVYKALHIALNQPVAIKLPDPRLLQDAENCLRFQKEAQVCHSLVHPNIVTVSDHGVNAKGIPFLVMEYLEGETLDARIKGGALPTVDETIDLMIDLADALDYAHNRGYLHRDLKPGNIMLRNPPARPKVLDFGLVKTVDSDLTKTGTTMGSPPYMSPEQFTGESMDARTDIYSLGCVMYETLTGVSPFAGDCDMACLYKHLEHVPKPPSELKPERNIPSSFDQIVAKALAKGKTDRYSNMKELKQDLEALRSGKQIREFQATSVRKKRTLEAISSFCMFGSVILAAIVILGSIPTIQRKSQPWLDDKEAAGEQLKTGNIALATNLMKSSLEKAVAARISSSETASIELALGKLYLQQNRLAEAMPVLQRLAQRTDLSLITVANGLVLLSEAELRNGDTSSAQARLKETLRLIRTNRQRLQTAEFVRVANRIAELFEQLGDFNSAITCLQYILAETNESGLDLNSARRYYKIGQMMLQRGQLNEAEEMHRKALNIAKALIAQPEAAKLRSSILDALNQIQGKKK